jgi:hypothetical protein
MNFTRLHSSCDLRPLEARRKRYESWLLWVLGGAGDDAAGASSCVTCSQMAAFALSRIYGIDILPLS